MQIRGRIRKVLDSLLNVRISGISPIRNKVLFPPLTARANATSRPKRIRHLVSTVNNALAQLKKFAARYFNGGESNKSALTSAGNLKIRDRGIKARASARGGEVDGADGRYQLSYDVRNFCNYVAGRMQAESRQQGSAQLSPN